MPPLSFVNGLLRFSLALRPFLADPITPEAARDHVRQCMRARDQALMRMVEGAVFGHPQSPYLRLFRAAGCEFGDVKKLVTEEGVEGTLQHLRRAGIYVTFEEFKGRAPAVRGSQTFVFRDGDFDNPRITAHFHSSSGGTRGTPTRTRVNLAHVGQSAPHWGLWFETHGVLHSPLVFWTPFHTGMANRYLMCARFGQRYTRWFTMAGTGKFRDRFLGHLVHGTIQAVGGFRRPESVPLSEPEKVGEYLTGLLANGQRPCVNTAPSAAARIALWAQSRGRPLQGVTFLLGAEPLTPARKQTIEATGAKAVPCYGFSEGGGVGAQCSAPTTVDDVHVFLDAFAVTRHAESVGDGRTVDAYLFTSLRPACPKIMLNTEIGDYGALETRRCGCSWDELGYTLHLHTIRSFEKLTGEGVTFIGSDLFPLLEEALPRKFGGGVGDYQLVEEQDGRGLACYSLLVNPSIGPVDERAVVETFLGELKKLRGWSHYALMADMWTQANIVQVKRQSPIPTSRGKVFPIRSLGPG